VSGMSTPASGSPQRPSFKDWMGSLWLYTLLRFGMFFALWGILWAVGLKGFPGVLLALVISIPLSLFLLAKPRDRMTRQMELRMQQRQVDRARIDADLEAESTVDPD
jgi:hypothetical protein